MEELLPVAVLLALLGHGALGVGIVNRFHATGLPRWFIKSVSKLYYVVFYAIPLLALWQWRESFDERDFQRALLVPFTAEHPITAAYAILCCAVALVHTPLWCWEKWRRRWPPEALISETRRTIDLAPRLGPSPVHGVKARLLAPVPYNSLLKIDVVERVLRLPRLPAALQGLSIAHVSDLHYSGRVTRVYYEEVVKLVNAMQADLIFITGDICDKKHCIPWIPTTLGKLQSRLGIYYVLGNHDLRVKDVAALRRELAAANIIDVGRRWELLRIAGKEVILAGNELPWFSPAADMSSAPTQAPPEGPFRILLSHSPDQLAYARRNDFDLMLAGHTHGGQIRFPLIGPVVCPSRYGVKYAAGVFDAPPTLLHVSRGASGLFPLRLRCPQEIVKLVLRS